MTLMDNEKGFLFLKCTSDQEKVLPQNKGPYRILQKDIKETFSKYFEIQKNKDTVYHGSLNPLPNTVFVEIRKKIVKT